MVISRAVRLVSLGTLVSDIPFKCRFLKISEVGNVLKNDHFRVLEHRFGPSLTTRTLLPQLDSVSERFHNSLSLFR